MAGEWENDERNGEGTYYYVNGDMYVGEWKDNCKHGKGVYTCASTKLKVCYLLFVNNNNNNFIHTVSMPLANYTGPQILRKLIEAGSVRDQK